ncbi:DMT family transporter [Ancylobacter sp. SL191]|uniref:DMT family transporter n=1 Tax=Ancylobacter sp. SL191 TaxID=2995166 RepID=UPI00226FC151|nr:DMT family transporter [Ancylobacter sp. SL191]WAC27286.1 DMT family transporter [Ancylobacter sp. SL191]
MTPRDVSAYLFLAIAWGLSFMCVVQAVHGFGWAGAVAFRAFIAAGTLLLIARLRRKRLDFSCGIKPLMIVGATTVAGQLVFLSYGMPLIGTAMSAILVATIPVFSMLIARVWGVERLNGGAVAGIALGALGILLLVGFPAVPVTADFLIGCAATLVATFSAAFGSVYAGRRLKGVGTSEATIGAFISGGLIALPLLILAPVPGVPGLADIAALVTLGVVMSAATYVLYFGLINSIGPTRAISVEFAVTGVAVLVGTILLGEPLSVPQIAGAVVIGLGCALVLGLIRLPRGKRPAEVTPPAASNG